MGKRVWFEVRVREFFPPDKWVKKSKFYEVRSPKDAADKYTGSGHIMSVQEVKKEQLLGIGEFFTLGPRLLKEFREGGQNEVTNPTESFVKDLEAIERNKGGYYGRAFKKATH